MQSVSQFLAIFNTTVVACAVTFVVTLIFSQKIKDYLHNVPSELRSALGSVESKAKADLKAAAADVVSRIAPATKPTTEGHP